MPVPRRLPPLPPAKTFGKFFQPVKLLSSTKGKAGMDKEREYPGRVFIANPELADSFVRALKLRENEIVIESFPGLGSLTRSLLSGGRSAEEAEDEELLSEWYTRAKSRSAAEESKWPTWGKELQPESQKLPPGIVQAEGLDKDGKPKRLRKSRARPRPAEAEEEDLNPALTELQPTNKPKLVIALDANERVTSAGLGGEVRTPPPRLGSWENTIATENGASQDGYFDALKQSPYEERLIAGPVDPFAWESVPYALFHPLVKDHLEKSNPNAPTAERAWTDPEPPITYVASMPASNVGELLALQWLHSAIGAAQGRPSFLWRWGRARMALLVTTAQYDVSRWPLSKLQPLNLRLDADDSDCLRKRAKWLDANRVS